jgi:hypothetical protein
MTINSERVAKRRKALKEKAVEYLGGKCSICGYDKCLNALQFHHTNPEDKDFSISAKGYTRSWKIVKQELNKCILVCANCHCELHASLVKKEPEEDSNYFGDCHTCGKQITKHHKNYPNYCCWDCYSEFLQSIQWPIKEELTSLVREKPMAQIGKDLGVSSTCIKNRCTKLGIKLPPLGFWSRKENKQNST